MNNSDLFMKLYIIGNGFDLHFGLPTNISDFVEILETKKTYDGYDAKSVFNGYGVNWGEYESSLSELEIDDIADDYIVYPKYSSDHESDRDWGITNIEYYLKYLNRAIIDSLVEMTAVANSKLKDIILSPEEQLLIENDSTILNFNYTSTVEYLYARNSYHIHGYLEKGNELIFGYKDVRRFQIENELESPREEDHDYYVDVQKEKMIEFYHSWKKELRIKELQSFLKGIGTIQEVIVLGLSMSRVDEPYLETIEGIAKPNKWVIYVFDGNPSYRHYSFAHKVETREWPQRTVFQS